MFENIYNAHDVIILEFGLNVKSTYSYSNMDTRNIVSLIHISS